MSEAFVVEIGREALRVAMMAAAPMLLASLGIGLIVSLIQVVTSLQDATLTFVPKILAVAAALALMGGWIVRILLEFTRQILSGTYWVMG